MKVLVQIVFADKTLNMTSYKNALNSALYRKSLDMWGRFNVLIYDGEVKGDVFEFYGYFEDDASEKQIKDFQSGSNFRYLSDYLIKYDSSLQNRRKRNRLLQYKFIEMVENEDLILNMTKKDNMGHQYLDIISSFIELLKKDDEDSVLRVERIKRILEK